MSRNEGVKRQARWLFWLGNLLLGGLGLTSLAQSSEVVTYYYVNQQGSVLATADAAGSVSNHIDYRPYGPVALGELEQGPGYSGHVEDTDSGLVYMQARFYDPDTGRFLGVDPQEAESGDVRGFSRFAYAADSPVVNTDSSGRCVDGLTCDTMAQSFANHPEATRPLAPVAIAGVAVMAAPTLVLSGAALLPEATSTLAMSGEEAADVAVGAAREAALGAQAAGAESGVASGVVTEGGDVFTGLSTNAGGPGGATNPLVQEALDAVPQAARSPFHGCCGEINAYSNLLNAGAKIQGSTAAAVRVTGSGALKILSACPSCQAVSEYLGVNLVSPK